MSIVTNHFHFPIKTIGSLQICRKVYFLTMYMIVMSQMGLSATKLIYFVIDYFDFTSKAPSQEITLCQKISLNFVTVERAHTHAQKQGQQDSIPEP